MSTLYNKSHKFYLIATLVLFISLIFNNVSMANLSELAKTDSQNKVLTADKAFHFTISNQKDKNLIEILVTAAPNTYLYKKNFKFNLNSQDITLQAPKYPQGIMKHDDFFGDVIVFTNDFKITIPYIIKNNNFKNPLELKINYQGCLDKTYCYPPQEKSSNINFNKDIQNINSSNNIYDENNSAFDVLNKASFWQVIISFFLFGVFLSFTPCVLPMIPILSSVIIGKTKINNKHVVHHNAFLLSLTYVLSMSAVYAIAGILVASAGQNLQAYLQAPAVIIVVTLLFVALSLSMFGLYEITIPHFIEDRLGALYRKQQGGSYLGAILMGIIATLIVSPCTSAPLAGALLYIATTGNITLGAFALFFLSLGMGIPLILIGLSSKKLLPKAGKWMESFRNLFGVILLGMAIYMLGRIIPEYVTLGLFGILFIIYAVLLGLLEPAPELKQRLIKAIALILAIIGTIYLIGAINYNTSVFQPLKNYSLSLNQSNKNLNKSNSSNFKSSLNWIKVNDISMFNSALNQFNDKQYALVDFTADWCSSCQSIERKIFANSEINKKLQKLLLIKVDITEYNDENKKLMQKLQVFNPPTLLFFNKDKQELKAIRITGEITPDKFKEYLNNLK